MAVLSLSRAEEVAQRMRTSLVIQNGIHLADRKRQSSIDLHKDDGMYFDQKAYAIHLGMHAPVKIFQVETEEDYVAALEFLYGHENQHVRSTAAVPYQNGIQQGVQKIIE